MVFAWRAAGLSAAGPRPALQESLQCPKCCSGKLRALLQEVTEQWAPVWSSAACSEWDMRRMSPGWHFSLDHQRVETGWLLCSNAQLGLRQIQPKYCTVLALQIAPHDTDCYVWRLIRSLHVHYDGPHTELGIRHCIALQGWLKWIVSQGCIIQDKLHVHCTLYTGLCPVLTTVAAI